MNQRIDRIDVFHNVRWARYKGAVFSELHPLAVSHGFDLRIVQIADTERERIGLSSVDLAYHQYPHELLFEGAYETVPKLRLLLHLVRQVYRTDAKLIVLPGYHRIEFWVMLALARLKRTKCAVFCDSTVHDNPQSAWKSFAKRLFFSQCAAFFCYGKRSREYLELHGADPTRIYTRVQAAALPASYSPTAALESRLANAPPSNAPRFLYVGRLSREKDLPTLLRAFAAIHEELTSATLVLVGAGPMGSELLRLAESLGVASCVEFRGAREGHELPSEYVSSTCLVLPSSSEPWGLVVNEALSYGCPAIVSDRCGCAPDLIEPGKNGEVFSVGDVDGLRSAMRRLASPMADRAAIAHACISSIASYTPSQAANQMMVGCEAVLARS